MSPRHFRQGLWMFFLAIICLQPIWYLLWVPARIPVPAALTIALLPLLPGLVTKLIAQKFAIVWAGVGVLLHFTFAAMEATIGGANRAPALLECFLCFGFFLCWHFAVIGEKRVARNG